MKQILPAVFFLSCFAGKAQKVESYSVNLYTDSLKKGTYNYINVDGLMNTGKYRPLDSTYILFTCGEAKFFGNSLYIPSDFTKDKVRIRLALKTDPSNVKEFDMYIKKAVDPPLRTVDEIMAEPRGKRKSGKG